MQSKNSPVAVWQPCYPLLSALLLVVGFGCAGIETAAAQGNKPLPVFEIDRTEHDFGDAFVGEDLVQVFHVRNQGAAPLELAANPIITSAPKVGVYRQPLSVSSNSGLLARLLSVGLSGGLSGGFSAGMASRAAAPT